MQSFKNSSSVCECLVNKTVSARKMTNHEEYEEMKKKLKEKFSELEEVKNRNTILVVKARRSYEEIQEAREELMKGLKDLSREVETTIGVKRVGEVDVKPFLNVCKQRFTGHKAMVQFAMLYSKWQRNINDLSWDPYKVVEDEVGTKEVVDEEDEKLRNLGDKWGEEVKNAVKTALEEMIECDPNDGDSLLTLWNFEQGRKATLKEGVMSLLHHIKTLKLKQT